MKKIVIFSPIIRPGGGPSGYVYNLMQSLSRQELTIDFRFVGQKFFDRSANDSRKWSFGLRLETFLSARGFYPFWSKSALELIEEAAGADIVVLHGVFHPRLVHQVKKLCRKLVFMPHSPSAWCDEFLMDYSSQNRHIQKWRYDYYDWAEKIAFVSADTVVFPSKGAMDCYKGRYSDVLNWKDVEFIASGVDVDVDEVALESTYISKSTLRVGYVGRYNRHKGYDNYCRVANLMSSNDLEFVSAGGGAIKPSDKVKNMGWCSDISQVFLGCDVIVVPNRVAYYDLMPIEAAAFGRPIVFSPVGGNVDQYSVLPDSVLADSNDIGSLCVAIEEAVNNKRKDPRFGVGNRAAFLNYYSSVAFSYNWVNFLSSLD